MKESLWGYWIIILGIFILTVMMLFNNYTTTNEQDYILIKVKKNRVEIYCPYMYDFNKP